MKKEPRLGRAEAASQEPAEQEPATADAGAVERSSGQVAVQTADSASRTTSDANAKTDDGGRTYAVWESGIRWGAQAVPGPLEREIVERVERTGRAPSWEKDWRNSARAGPPRITDGTRTATPPPGVAESEPASEQAGVSTLFSYPRHRMTWSRRKSVSPTAGG